MFKRIMIFALVLLTTAAVAATPPNLALFIDGKLASGNVIIIKGQSYVLVADMAKALNMKLSKSGTVISLESPPSLPAAPTVVEPLKPVEPVIQKGTIKGTVTYYFNDNFGDKPDTGSTVWLVPREKWPKDILGETPLLPPNVHVMDGYQSILLRKEEPGKEDVHMEVGGVKTTSVDGNGNYEFRDVLAGEYIVIIQSSHTEGGRDRSHNVRDILGRTDAMYVTAKPGETVDCSNDFGMTLY